MLLLIAIFFVICSICSIGAIGEIEISRVEEITKGFSKFSDDLFEQQFSEAQHENFNVSPFSVAMALSLLSQAANGTTFEELRNVLNLNHDKATVATQFHDHLELLKKSAYGSQLLIANRIYVPKGFQLRKSFQDIAAEKFYSGIESVDFKEPKDAAQTINQFVKNKTNEKITEIVKPEDLDNQTGAILINAITLKSKWSCPFSVEDTIHKSFFFNINPGEPKLALTDYMRNMGTFPTVYLRELGIRVLRLNYKNSSLSFIIVMPIHVDNNLHILESRIRNYTMAKLIGHMGPGECSIKQGNFRIYIPKIKIETELNLNHALRKMGITELFTDRADLSGLSESNERIKVKKVIHKVLIDINEDHDEPVEKKYKPGPKSYVRFANSFMVNMPFSYYIWDSLTNTTILNGRVEGLPEYIQKSKTGSLNYQ